MDLFLNLMIEHEPILAIMSVQGNYLAWQKKFVIVPAWREKFEKIPAWRGKVGIVHMLTNPVWWESLAQYLSRMAGEGYDDSCALSVFRTQREFWGSSYAIIELTVHSVCVMVVKYSMSLRTKER